MGIKIGINGFGRIGRLVYRALAEHKEEFDVVGINDLSDAKTLGHLLKYDSVHGRYPGEVKVDGENLVVDGAKVPVLTVRDPAELPWKGVDIAVESTGVFRKPEDFNKHLDAGAKRVIVSAPPKGDIDATIVMGVNDDTLNADMKSFSNASCTTNCLAPVAKVLNDSFGVVKGLMTTVHAYTSDQRIVDTLHSDLRRARAGCINIIPTSTGAAVAVGKVIPALNGKLNGMSLRVPTPTGSCVDLVAETEKKVSVDAVNEAMKAAAAGPLDGVLQYCDEPIVSTDIIHNPYSSIYDSLAVMTMGDNMVKVISWYDNEWGFSCRMADLMVRIAAL